MNPLRLKMKNWRIEAETWVKWKIIVRWNIASLVVRNSRVKDKNRKLIKTKRRREAKESWIR